MQRRKFLAHLGHLTLAFSAFSPLHALDFQKPKIGYLPITDHLLIIAKELYPDSFTAVKFSSWVDLAEALRAGSIDAAFILTPLALKLSSENLGLKALMAAHRNGSALTTSIEISNINELKNKRIAIPSRFSTHYLLLAELLKKHSLSIDEVKLVDMSPPEMPFALQSKQIDAFIVAEPFGVIAQNFKAGKTLVTSYDIQKDHICCLFVASKKILEQKELCQKLVNNFVKSAKLIKENPDKALVLAKKMLGHSEAVLRQVIETKNLISYESLVLSQDDILRTTNELKELKLGDFKNTYANFVESSFIKNAF
ncbi:twin-arginine translocation pathway signal protein [Campylobacter sp. MIT 12-8780]|uniref:ABC transporter substrate-binding protein n=1 Tax=unclassified Campylobacter TaxID=2593542 RepID=UPI00115F0CCE|nr:MULTISPECIES: ABC transporter substrate-binding protein [unclassified Campylobacter]NDJ26420.1 ABC transporter substrate-binding protein [Campylobacter sp. MIT 19-121]TQR42995.1 twin-arginine translocation pathway signal protein [Campylobacter sp. MIT 12-8780]